MSYMFNLILDYLCEAELILNGLLCFVIIVQFIFCLGEVMELVS